MVIITFEILSLFPKMFSGVFSQSILGRAASRGLIEVKIHNLRKWAVDKRGTVDDRPYGGGPGMILMVEPIYGALKGLGSIPAISGCKAQKAPHGSGAYANDKTQMVVLLSASGRQFTQKMAWEWSRLERLVLICGHYEGVDQRVGDYLADEEVSIGPYVLSGGEVAGMAVVETVARLVPGVIGKKEALQEESYGFDFKGLALARARPYQRPGPQQGLAFLEYPQYTRPAVFRADGHCWRAPKVLLSGNHKKITAWRKRKSFLRTQWRVI